MRAALPVRVLLLAAPALAQAAPTTRAVDEGGEPTYRFEPARLVVAPSAVVTLQGGSVEPHTLTHRAAQAERRFDSGNVDPGKTGTVAAPADEGEYPFACLYHPGMTGTLVVQKEDAAAPKRTPAAAALGGLLALAAASFIRKRA